MWPEPQKNGKVKFVERYINPMTGKNGKVSVTMDKDTRSTRKQAEKILDIRIDEALQKHSTVSTTKKDTLEGLVEAYRTEQEKTVKASTYRRNYFTANSMLKVLGKDTLLCKLSAPYIRTRMYALESPNASINELLKRTKGILRWGYNNDYLDDISFLDKIKPLPDQTYRAKIEDKFLETEDFLTLISGMRTDIWRMMSSFLGLSGLRVGEAIALKKEDIDLQNRLIHVSTTYDSNNDLETTAKSTASHRDVYIQDELLKVCKEVNAYMLKQRLMNGYGSSPLFFQGKDGAYIKYYAYNKYVKENALRILDREKVTPHIFRHTHTCMLAERNVPLETITRRLGHEDSRITQAVYLHVTKKMKQYDYDQIAKVKIM